MSLEDYRARAGAILARAGPPTLETLLTSADYFGLVTASPLQRAICRVADGRALGELARHPHVIEAMGDVSALRGKRPRRMLVLAAIRSAKSMIASAAAIRQSQVVDVSHLSAGDVPRVSIVSVRLDLADVVKSHLIGNILARPRLSALLYEKPSPKGDHVILRHPSGRPIEIKVVAGASAGSTLVARWSAGVIYDEAPRMVGAAEGVVNLDDMRSATAGRVLPGAASWEIGSPWAPFGPIYKAVTEHERAPTEDLVVVRARGPWMNPVWWTPERVEHLRMTDPMAYRTDAMAEFADPEEALIPSTTIEACSRATMVEEPREGHEYAAAIDPGTRGNAWTLVISTRRDGKRVVCKARQWIGSSVTPLDPEEVFRDIAGELAPYRLDSLETDQWSTDALRVIARAFRLKLVEWPMTQAENTEAYLDLARRMASGDVVIPPDPVLRADLLRLKKRVTQNGLAIVLPETSDGRHCDYAPAVVRALRRFVAEPAKPRTPETLAAAQTREQAEMLKRAQERFAPQNPRPAWRRGYGV